MADRAVKKTSRYTDSKIGDETRIAENIHLLYLG